MNTWYTLYTLNILCCFCLPTKYSAIDVTEVRLSECATAPHDIALHSSSDYYHNINNCFLDKFVLCTRKQVSGTVDELNLGFNTLGVCGVLTSYFISAYLPWRFYINVLSDFNMNIVILSFHFPWIHSGCPVYGMIMEGSILGENNNRLYCGKRNPWSQIYDNKCSVRIYGNEMYPMDLHIYFLLVIRQRIITHSSVCFIDPSSMLNFQAFSHLASSHKPVIFRVVTKPYMLLMMHFVNTNDAQYFDIRDGPGELSPFVQTSYHVHVSGRLMSTAYIVTIHLKIYIDTTDIDFVYESMSVLDIRRIVPCIHTGGIRSLHHGESSDEITFHSQSTVNVGCHIFYSSVSDLKFLTFPKLDIIYYTYFGSTVFNESLLLSCQFGGLFAFSLDYQENVKAIYQYCNNLDDSLSSFIMSEEQTLLVSIIWFRQYSHGFFKGSLNMIPCKYRNIHVTQSFNHNIMHLVNYKTACEHIQIDGPKSEITKDDINTTRLTITNEYNIMGPTFLNFQFQNSSPLDEMTCLHHVVFNMSFYEPYIPFINYFSYHWRSGRHPMFEFGILQSANITLSRCLLSKGTFVIVVEKPFCDTLWRKGRMTELVDNSMILLRKCFRDLFAPFSDGRKVVKYFKLPEGGDHKTTLTVWNEPDCSLECSSYKFTLLEYITHAGILCEYTINMQGHTTMTFVSVHTQEPFLLSITNYVDSHSHTCLTKQCDPALTKSNKYVQNSTNNRFRDFISFKKRYVQ